MKLSRRLTRGGSVAAAIALLSTVATTASAARIRDDAGAQGGLRITGTVSFKIFIPADVVVTGGGSGGDTITGKYNVDLRSTHLPFNNSWTSNGSTYEFTDKLDMTVKPPPGSTCGPSTLTANANGRGTFPQHATESSKTQVGASWWATTMRRG